MHPLICPNKGQTGAALKPLVKADTRRTSACPISLLYFVLMVDVSHPEPRARLPRRLHEEDMK